ncbi:LacI family DNA-binding transcriptional regulator [uncultured Cohaesibacter sp.]|uniref:LacI family DNA-binding transcriptional regulator n=1 Tax=uncultured Cohaesibacter sp. TaxID=1002546 RepID=UPI00292F94AA|nr:LacI family DNA-binding transcriptional regulator [uncultured Cohaesibacter sp.]
MSSDSKKAKPKKKNGRASLAMVAEHAGVSIATASRIINGVTNKASKDTILRVRASVEALNYRPASIGRALRCQESRIVGLLAAAIENPAMAAIASSIEWALRDEGYVLSLCDTHERADVQDEYLLEMQSQLARAVIIIGAVQSSVLDRMREHGVSMLFVNRPDPGNFNSPYVGLDNYQAGVDIANCLTVRGLDRFGLIHASLDATAATYRRQGVLDGMAQAGIGPERILHFTTSDPNPLEVGYACMKTILEMPDPPRVILCMSDVLAYGAQRRVVEAGLDPVRDFAFFGFDNNPINIWIADWLNAVGVPVEGYGKACVAALKAIWGDEGLSEPVYLPHIVRLSGFPFPGEA